MTRHRSNHRQAKITARAGDNERYPEDTLLAFTQAIAQGAERIELDVQYTSDHRLVVHHLYELGITNDGEGLIFEKDVSYLRSLDAGSWLSPDFAGEPIPLLEEVFRRLGKRTEYELDLKGFTLDYLHDVVDLVRAHHLLSQVEFTSAFPLLLSHAKRLAPDARVGMFAHNLLSDWMPLGLKQTILRANAHLGSIDVVHCSLDVLTPDFVHTLQEDGLLVHAANCDTPEDLAQALAVGVDQLSTNHLQLALRLRKEMAGV